MRERKQEFHDRNEELRQETIEKQAAEIERLRERDKHTVAIGELESWKLSQAGLQKENDKLREENDALKANCPYPWCPECKIECRATDEDGCCSSCGVDTVWPEASDVPFREENKRLTAELKTMTAMWSSLRHKLDEVREENKQSREALQEVHVRLQRLWEMTPASGTLLKLIRTMGDCIGTALKQTDPGNSAGQHRR